MAQPPGTLDDLQPEDLSTSALPSVIDLTRKDKECVLNPASLTAMVQNPGWFQNSGPSNIRLPFPDTDPSSVHPAGHIQPDNAFSHTTVTLSYVSRSHVFSTESSSGHSSVYSVPSFSKYPLQPSCDLDKTLGETGITLNEHHSENINGPIDLAAQTELWQSLSQARLGLKTQLELHGAVQNVESYLGTRPEHRVDNGKNVQNGDFWGCSESLQECSGPLPGCPTLLQHCPKPLQDSTESLQDNVQANSNSVCKSPKSFSEYSNSLPECPNPVQEHPASLQGSSESSLEYLQGHPELLPGSSELVRQESLEEQPASLAESAESLQKCPIPLDESSVSLECPISCLDSPQECQEIKCHEHLQKATSHDPKEFSDRDSPEVVFVMSTSRNTEVVPGNDGITGLSSLEGEFVSPLEDPVSPATSVDSVDDVVILPEVSGFSSGDNSFLETTNDGSFVDSSTQETTHPGSAAEDCTPSLHSKETGERTLRRRKATLAPLLDLTGDAILEDNLKRKIPHINGNAKALQKTLNDRRLPVRASRGMHLEAIVMNINSSRYNVSGCIRTGKKSSQIADEDSKTKLCKNDMVSKVKKSKEKMKPKASPRQGQTSANSENCKNATSNSELTSAQGKSHQVHSELSSCPVKASPVWLKRKSSSDQTPQSGNETAQELLSQTDIKVDMTAAVPSTAELLKSPKKSPSKGRATVSAKKPRLRAKTNLKSSHQKRRKKIKGGPSSMFSPKEPEIKLKYINYKEEKRDSRLDSFSPFIRVERKESTPSLFTVVNYPEEVRTQRKKNQQQGSLGKYAPTVVPSTSCLQLGRLSTRGEHQRTLVCCLCGHSANAMDLGDLHGPYYSEGYQPSAKRTTAGSGLKEEDSSDSDSSSCSGQGRRGRKRAAQSQWTTIKSQQWRDSSHSPAAKRPRADVEDWYSPPVLPLEPCEYWLHEDCGVWSTGVYLVKGRVYGLVEAVRAAQNTVCSACREPGATLGCFFKGCPNKYHYRCALQSDCVLIEDNFSMKCKKHKNKSIKVPQNCRRDDR